MSLWAKDKNGNHINIENNGVSKGSTDDDFYCPSCGAKMWFRSQSSNEKTAHFAAHHKEGCDIGFTSANVNVRDYRFSHESLKAFLVMLQNDGIKSASTIGKYTHSKRNNVNKTLNPNNQDNNPLQIRTLRQLHNALASSSPDEVLYNDVKVKSIYCGKSTSFLYTKFINGLHLVFAQLDWYSVNANICRFRYPSENNNQITVQASFANPSDMNDFADKHGGHVHQYFIIFAEFVNNRCVLESLTQIIHLHR